MSDKITIITVVYNAVSSIEKTMLSVLNQTYGNIEYLVIDGGSTDGTVEKIKEFEKLHCSTSNLQPPTFTLRWLSERDDGIYDAMNKGLRLATGEWVNFMNAGDVFHANDTVEKVFVSAIPDKNVDVVYGNCREIDGEKFCDLYAGGNAKNLEHALFFRHNAAFVRRATHLAHFYHTELKKELSFALDYHAFFEMYNAGCVFQFVDVCVLDYQKEGASAHPCRAVYKKLLISCGMKLGLRDYIKLAVPFAKELPAIKRVALKWECAIGLVAAKIVSPIILLRLQGAHVGKNCRVGRGVKIIKPHRLTMGDGVVVGAGCQIDCTGKVLIGSGTHLGDHVYVNTCVMSEDGRGHVVGHSPVVLGEGVRIAEGLNLYPGFHANDDVAINHVEGSHV